MDKQLFNKNALTDICSALINNESFSVAHLVAFLNFDHLISHECVAEVIDDSDAKLVTPVQIAIKNKNLTILNYLLPRVNIDHSDHNNDNVYHYAADTGKEIIELLTLKSINKINEKNKKGYSPLHKACLSNNFNCVEALIISGANVDITVGQDSQEGHEKEGNSEFFKKFFAKDSNSLNTQELKNGGTPLHWGNSKDVLEVLIKNGCSIQALDFNGSTPLHVMVSKNKLDCVICLLAHGANINITNKYGSTPLNIAIEKKLISIIQCLIVFGCEINSKNKDSQTIRHLVATGSNILDPKILFMLDSVGAMRCPEINTNCPPGCNFNGSFKGIHPSETSTINDTCAQSDGMDELLKVLTSKRKGTGRLLCLDGGGIKGLVMTQMLLDIEELSKRSIHNLFDWIAGTSTGGILALAIGCGKTLRESLSLYLSLKDRGLKPYNSETLETVLKEVFGENSVIAEIKKPKVMISATLAEQIYVNLHWFRS